LVEHGSERKKWRTYISSNSEITALSSDQSIIHTDDPNLSLALIII